MKPRNRQQRSLNVSNSRWMAYVVAGLATTSGGAISAEGAIHYSGPVNFKFDSRLSQTHTFPLSQGAVLEGIRNKVGFNAHSASLFIDGGAVSNAIRDYSPSYPFVAAALPRGSIISQGFFGPNGSGAIQNYYCGWPGWEGPGTHFIGFRFDSGSGTQYGWVRIKYAGCDSGVNNKFIVKDYAWGDPGDQIKAGQTQLDEGDTQVAPQAAKSSDAAPLADSQGSLGLLALGAVGLQAWRKSRSNVNSAAP